MIRNEQFVDGKVVYAEVVDLDAGTITFEENGAVVSSRALTDVERAANTPTASPKSPDEKLAEAKAVLDQITALPAPVLTADVVDLLDDLRGVL